MTLTEEQYGNERVHIRKSSLRILVDGNKITSRGRTLNVEHEIRSQMLDRDLGSQCVH